MMRIFTKLPMLLALCLFTMGAMAQTTYYVKTGGTGTGTGPNGWADAALNLQDVIDAASAGDQIFVAAGTYFPTEKLDPAGTDRDRAFVLKEGVKLYGGFTGTTEASIGDRVLNPDGTLVNITTLSGDFNEDDAVAVDVNGTVTGITNNTENAYHVVVSYNHTPATVLDGFTISGGNADGSGSVTFGVDFERDYAGGVFIKQSSPTLNNLIVENNHAGTGAGMCLVGGKQDANPAVTINISNSTLSNNISTNTDTGGGGMFMEGYTDYTNKVELDNVTFFGNLAERRGGGILARSYLDLKLQGGSFSSNVTTNTANWGGGAIYIVGGSEANKTELEANYTKFENNITARYGGVIYFNSSTVGKFNNVVFQENEAQAGGVVYSAAGTSNRYITIDIKNSIFYKNKTTGNGGAITASTRTTIAVTGGTFYANESGALGGAVRRAAGTVNVYNSIIHGNIAQGDANTNDISGTMDLKNTLTQVSGTTGVDGVVVDAGPSYLFKSTDPLSPDFLRLDPTEGNPAIDAGDNALYTTVTGIDPLLDKDLDGNDRVFNSGLNPTATIDMGAYENITVPLPVEISTPLSAKINGSAVVLAWATATETNNSHFLLQRSSDSGNFTQIANVPSKGNGAKYSYTDFSPATGTSYYRLVQIDNDGKETVYSPVSVNISLNAQNAVSVYPNPVSGTEANVSLGDVAAGSYGYKVISTAGSVVQQGTVGYNGTSATVSVGSLPAGVYVIQFSNGAQAKLIKQ